MKLYLDAMVWIYYLERQPQFFSDCEALLARIQQGRGQIVVSHFVLAELLVLPKRKGDAFTVAQYRRVLAAKTFKTARLTSSAAERFAEIRARNRVRPADALHLAFAPDEGVDYFVTYDTGLPALAVPGIGAIVSPNMVP